MFSFDMFQQNKSQMTNHDKAIVPMTKYSILS